MDEVLHLKFCQHNGLRALLFSTYPAELVYDDLRDRFWGRDGTGAGRNELGKSLMRVRERLRNGGGSAGVAPVLRVSWYGEYSVLLCHSSHDVEYEKGLYPTALHLFEARKFLDHRPDLADRIRRCENVEEVNVVSAELAEFTRRDWDNVALSTVGDRFYPYFVLLLIVVDECLFRWTKCYTSSSASTTTCAHCFSAPTLLISSMSRREIRFGGTVETLARMSLASRSCACASEYAPKVNHNQRKERF